jgi:hypothetical protein
MKKTRKRRMRNVTCIERKRKISSEENGEGGGEDETGFFCSSSKYEFYEINERSFFTEHHLGRRLYVSCAS